MKCCLDIGTDRLNLTAESRALTSDLDSLVKLMDVADISCWVGARNTHTDISHHTYKKLSTEVFKWKICHIATISTMTSCGTKWCRAFSCGDIQYRAQCKQGLGHCTKCSKHRDRIMYTKNDSI